MGAITQAMASAARKFGAEIRTAAPVGRILVRDGRARRRRARGRHGDRRRVVVSNADPKRTFLGLVERSGAARGVPPRDRRHQDGRPVRQGQLRALGGAARHRHAPRVRRSRSARSSRSCPSLEFAERCYDIAKLGEIPEELWVDCVVASNVDPSLAPEGRHVMTCFVQYVPYRLKQGTWDEKRELLGDRVVRKIGEYAPNVPGVGRRAPGPDAARPRADLRPDRGQHLPRRPDPRAALLHAAGRRLGAVPHARRRASTSAAPARIRAAA